jgi:hypothetical protein
MPSSFYSLGTKYKQIEIDIESQLEIEQNLGEDDLSDIERSSAVFKPKAWLLSLLGDQLITKEIVAVVELLKNSFDAGTQTSLLG